MPIYFFSQLIFANQISNTYQLLLCLGEYDVCPSENVVLSAQLPELTSSEILVAMTSLDSANNESLVDMTGLESSSNSESLVDMSSIEGTSSEGLVMNETNLRLVCDSQTSVKATASVSILTLILDDVTLQGFEFCLFLLQRKNKSGTNFGSARTNYTYEDVIREKVYRSELECHRKIKWHHPGDGNGEDPKTNKKAKNVVVSKQTDDLQNCKMSILPDLVLGAAGMSDPHSLIVKVRSFYFFLKTISYCASFFRSFFLLNF